MNNYTALSIFRSFYRKPQGGYPASNRGAINIGNAPVVIRTRGSKHYRPVQRCALVFDHLAHAGAERSTTKG